MDGRAIAFNRVTSVPTLDASNVFSSGALVETPAVKPFVIIQMDVVNRVFEGVEAQNCVVYVHDENGSMAQIDSLHAQIKAAMIADPAAGEEALVGIDFVQRGSDLSDDFFNTVFKTATYTLNGKA